MKQVYFSFYNKIICSFVCLFFLMFLPAFAFASVENETQIVDNSLANAKLAEELGIQNITNISKLLVLDTKKNVSRLYVFKRFNNEWVLLQDVKAEIGRGGVRNSIMEGSYATPRGMFGFRLAFGHKQNPGSLLPYYQLKDGDVWVTDPQSRYYNLFVRKNTVLQEWLSAIDLYKATLSYAYTLVIDYNLTNKEPYKGSGIFLQCSIGKKTNGSIAVPTSFMKEMLLFVDETTKIYIR